MMSLFKLPKLRRFSSALESVRGRFARSNGRSTGERAYRRLLIDPLEERQLLSLSPWNIDDNMVNEVLTEDQYTIAAQSVAADHDGDFVVVWARDDGVFDASGDPVVDPETGGDMTDMNIYARYFTDEVQRVTLPDEIIINNNPGAYGTFSLTYGGNEIQKITVSEALGPFNSSDGLLVGDVTFGFDVDDSGTIDPGETTTITFVGQWYTRAADAIQTGLRGIGGALSDVVVTNIGPKEYMVYFGNASGGEDQPELVIVDSDFSIGAGFLPGMVVSTVRNPGIIADIPVSPDNPWLTAQAIEQAFLYTSETFAVSPVEFPPPDRVPGSQPPPYIFPEMMRTALPRVTVTPVSATQFDITFGADLNIDEDWIASDSNKKDHPELVISAVADENGVSLIGSPQVDVTTLKQTSPEFRVNAEEPDDPFTPWPDVTNQIAAAVAMDADGDFVITWQSEITDAENFGSLYDIFARRFSPASMVSPTGFVPGVRALGNQFRVNTFTTNAQEDPAIGMDDDGNFTIAWANEGQDISYFNGIVAQQFNRDGERVGGEWLVNDEDTAIHIDPYVALSSDGHFVVTWSITNDPNYVVGNAYMTRVNAELYDPTGQVLLQQFTVGGGARSTASFDMNNNFIVSRGAIVDNDNIGISSSSVRVKMYDLDGNVIRSEFRANSASLDPENEALLWPLCQIDSQVVLDADGDVVVTYEGFGPDVSENGIDIGIDAAMYALQKRMMTPPDTWPDDVLYVPDFDEIDFELGQLWAGSNSTSTLLRGEANGIMFSRWDADPQIGELTNLYSDCLANNYRDGHNTRYFITLDKGIAGGDFTIRLWHPDVGGHEDIVIEPAIRENDDGTFTFLVGETRTIIENLLEAATRTGVNWPEDAYGGPVSVRVIGDGEIHDRDGTYWEIEDVRDDEIQEFTIALTAPTPVTGKFQISIGVGYSTRKTDS